MTVPRRWSFGLRTMMVLVALAGMLCPLLRMLVDRWEQGRIWVEIGIPPSSVPDGTPRGPLEPFLVMDLDQPRR